MFRRMSTRIAPELIGPLGREALMLPMIGTRICAGFPSPADDFLDGELDLARILAPNRAATFLWRVSGHSMLESGIDDGDVVVVDRSAQPKHGDVVVAVINGEVSLKLYRIVGGRATLCFANRAMPPFVITESASVEVWGTVTWTLHRPRVS